VMNSDYINSFVKNQFEQRKTETESKEQERLAQGRTMLLVAEEMIRRKTHAERHGDTSVTQPLQDDDFVQLFAELDKYGESEVMTEPESFKQLFEAVGDRLHDNKMAVIMKEIAGALQVPEWWKGQMTLESLRAWIESDPEVAPLGARLNESAMRFKEDELLRGLFDELDRDGGGMLSDTEMMQLGDVTHVTLTVAECRQAIAEIDVDGDGSLCFEEFELWFYGPSKIANKIKSRSVAAAEMESRESKVMMRVEDGDNVKIEGKVVTNATYETVRACKAVTGGKWYYEVMIGDRTNGHIGFARSDFQCKSADGNGVGDPLSNGQSWGYDGCSQHKLNHGPTPYPDGTEPEEGNGWSTGDSVGCLLDLDAGEISFTLNGVDLGVAFKGVRATNKLKIFPCATLNDGPHLFKFASTECKYADRYKEHRMFTRAPDNAMDEVWEMEVRRKRRGYEAQARREALQHGEAWEDPQSFGSSGANLKDILVGHHVDIPKHGQGIVKDYKSKKGHTIYLSTGETVVLDLTKKKLKFRVQSEGFLIDRVRKAMETWEPGSNRSGVQGAHLNPLDLFLNPLGLFLCTSIPFIWRILSAFLRA
jgi:hypothetical protein